MLYCNRIENKNFQNSIIVYSTFVVNMHKILNSMKMLNLIYVSYSNSDIFDDFLSLKNYNQLIIKKKERKDKIITLNLQNDINKQIYVSESLSKEEIKHEKDFSLCKIE